MSYHIISIDSPQSAVTCSKGRLIVDSANESHSVPMEDVAAVVITSFKCTLTGNFLIEASKRRMGVVLCERFKPVAVLLPVEKGTDTEALRNLARLSPQLKRRLWEKTVDAKCRNQAGLALLWNPGHPLAEKMRDIVRASLPARESDTARVFWAIFAETFADENFTRGREAGGFNALFNYAYAILLSTMLRDLLAYGLDPSFGIFHSARPHAAPLAYDLMEPFRPAFDANVVRWICSQRGKGAAENSIAEVTGEYRKHIVSTLHALVSYLGREMTLRSAVTAVVASFRSAVRERQSGPYEPWKISSIKWVG